jgi:pimeloyl-ACP methyl ester carboxylesterase
VSATPFTIDIPQTTLDDLNERLARTRFPDQIETAGWDYGTNLDYIKGLVEYWRTEFDWRKHEQYLNLFEHFRTEVDGFGLHFIHERGEGPKPLPLILNHGWPDSFFRFHKLIPLLTEPAAHGGSAEDAFDVIVPSMPGYGFSDKPTEPGMAPPKIAELYYKLMTETLGYERFGAHGGDWGSGTTESLAMAFPDALIGIHLTDIPYWHLFTTPAEELTETEREYMEEGKEWQQSEGAYALIQGSKPQTLAYGLTDSPAGLAGWIIEKFRAWSDCNGDAESKFTRDELLTNIMIYWATGTINSANRLYYEAQHAAMEHYKSVGPKRVEVPTGAAIFPKDLATAPRAFGERFFNIQRWTEMPRGGHFAAMEEPELLAEDIRAFFRPLRNR